MRHITLAMVLAAFACDGASDVPAAAPPPEVPSVTPNAPIASTPPSCTTCDEKLPVDDKLRVRWLGVQGFLLENGGESVLTAPLYTRPDMIAATAGLPTTSDVALVEQKLPSSELAGVRAVLAGHAHYDHLLDVPAILQRATSATLYSNRSAKKLLAAYAPDRAAKCAGEPAATSPITRARVVAMEDGYVDWQGCLDKKPDGVSPQGKWVDVPGSHVRILAVCSEHPAQFGPVHYGEGEVGEEPCSPPKSMADWKEGITLAFLVDFLDPNTRAPLFRVYYQDAPTTAPVGLPHAQILKDKRIDLALLTVGSSNNVEDAPQGTLRALAPRFAIGGHWEDFFGAVDAPPQPITMLDVPGWANRAKAEMQLSNGAAASTWLVSGKASTERVVVPEPGATFEIAR